MNLQDMHQFMSAAALVCAFGVLLNLIMVRKRGKSAALLAGAFFCLGIALYLYSSGFPIFLAAALAAITLGLLVADFLLRMKKIGGQ